MALSIELILLIMLVFKMFVVKLNISIIFYLHYINVQSAFAEAPRQGFVQLWLQAEEARLRV